MEPTDYISIDCALYSEYELVIMHHKKLQLSWRDSGGNVHIGIVTPTDLSNRNGAEFMVVTGQDGATVTIRLDRIMHFTRV
jgi:transcriptional antiterminator Rof (Rho-off)